MKKQLHFFLFILLAVPAWAQQLSFTATLDTNKILIGQQTTLHLSAKNLQTINNLIWPLWPDSLDAIEVISVNRDTAEENGIFSITEHFVLTSFDSGFVVIPPFKLINNEETAETEALILNIGTVEILADKDYYDIKAPVDPPFDFLYWLKKLWYVAVILAVLIAVGLWFFLRKRKEKITAQIPVDSRSPAQRAKENLLAIREARVWQDGKTKLYYSQVSDTVRTYLEEEFNVPAMEMVSDELLDAMQTKIAASAQILLRPLLQQADAVKFAKAKPGPDQHAKIWDDALAIIEMTEPKTQIENE